LKEAICKTSRGGRRKVTQRISFGRSEKIFLKDDVDRRERIVSVPSAKETRFVGSG